MKIRKYSQFIWLVVLIVSLFVRGESLAQDEAETNTTPPQETRTISLREFGYDDIAVFTPNSIASYLLRLPSRWRLIGPLILDFQIQTFVTGEQAASTVQNYQAILDIQYNFIPVERAILELSGANSVSVRIEENADEILQSRLSDNRQVIDLILNTNFLCGGPVQAGMLVDADSTITFTYEIDEISTDLSQLPLPIYEELLEPDPAILIIPDEPDASELSALYAFVASLGRDTSLDNFEYHITTASLLTDEQRSNSHLVYVGKAGRFEDLPRVPLEANEPTVPVQADDGIVQMIVSPWNSARVLLSISGETDVAIIKAGQAASSEAIRTSGASNLAIISEVQVNPQAANTFLRTNQSFGISGYNLVSLVGIGQQSTQYPLYIDPEAYNSSNYELQLLYSHSTVLDYEQSSVEILVNGTYLSTLRLSDETANNAQSIIAIPREQLNPGNNFITILSKLERIDPCLDPSGSSIWFSISSASRINQKVNENAADTLRFFDLNDYPYPFVLDPSLANLAFVLPRQNLSAWIEAGNLAYNLGRTTQGLMMSPDVMFGDAINEETLSNHHLIVVGQPKDIPFVAELGAALPARFEPGSNFALEEDFQIAYRLSPDKTLGYLQLITSPANSNQVILAVLGTNDMAVTETVATLISSNLRRFRQGTLQLVENGVLIPVQMSVETATTFVLQPTAMPDASDPFSVEPIDSNLNDFEPPRPTWIIDIAVYSSFIISGILLFVGVSRLFVWVKRRIQKEA